MANVATSKTKGNILCHQRDLNQIRFVHIRKPVLISSRRKQASDIRNGLNLAFLYTAEYHYGLLNSIQYHYLSYPDVASVGYVLQIKRVSHSRAY